MSSEDRFIREILQPDQCKQIAPQTSIPIWTYKYRHPTNDYTLAIATAGSPGSEKLSLGGFRIAPKDRTDKPGFSAEKEAIELANGMDEKVFWSRITNVAGPLGINYLQKIVGGKCVLAPSVGSRIGEKNDFDLLNFASNCLLDFESHARVYLTTGQDLGHGIMSDGRTSSLKYLHSKFIGSVLEDTSKPTGEGNFNCLKGMLRGVGLSLSDSFVGLIGCGNVGEHVFRRLLESGSKVAIVESAQQKIEMLRKLDIEVFEPSRKQDLFKLPIDAVCVNASGGTLDDETIGNIANSNTIKVICGSENLAMPNQNGTKILLRAKKILAPMELCGMMGYLTAVEEYLCTKLTKRYDVASLFEAAQKLEDIGLQGTKSVIKSGFKSTFEDSVKEIYMEPACKVANA